MTYNLTMTGTGVVGFLQMTNNIVNGWLGVSILFALLIVTFYMCKAFQTKKGLAPATFLCVTEAIFFRYMNLINDQILFGAFGLLVVSVIILFLQED